MSRPLPTDLSEVTLLRQAIQALRSSGQAVIEAGERAGLCRVNDGRLSNPRGWSYLPWTSA